MSDDKKQGAQGAAVSRLESLSKHFLEGSTGGQASTVARELEQALAAAVEAGKIPHAVVFATNKDGSFTYSHASGLQNYTVDKEPIKEDALFMLASQTKLLTAVAALKVVDQGLIGLDDDVCPHLPELAQALILTAFEDSPVFEKRKNPITLRQLLSHTSGSGYPFTPELLKYLGSKGLKADSPNAPTITERYDLPLLFEPGTSWAYGPGIDWSGLLVERLSKRSLEEYMQEHIFRPLGITGITFWPEKTLGASALQKIPELVVRRSDGTYGPNTKKTLNTASTDCFGGHGAYAQLGDYIKVQRSLLANDGVLLSPATADELFKPQIGAQPAAVLNYFSEALPIVGEVNPDIEVSYGLGGMVFLADDVGRRRKGTLSWGGLVNPFWIIDREAGIALTVGFQVLPTGDKGVVEMTSACERAVYKMAGLS